MVKSHHFHLRCHHPLFHNFKQFNIKADLDHHLIIWKEVDELLVKDTIEPCTSGSGFHSNVFVVPKHAGGL